LYLLQQKPQLTYPSRMLMLNACPPKLPVHQPVESQLQQLVAIAAALPAESAPNVSADHLSPDHLSSDSRQQRSARRQILGQILRLVMPQLWKDSSPYYPDAVQQTLLYVCRNLHKYEPHRSGVMTWINVRLRYELLDLKLQAQQDRQRLRSLTTSQGLDLDMPSPSLQPELPNLILAIQAWAQADRTGELRAEHLRDRPQVHSQQLILDRMDPDLEWRCLSRRYGVALSSLSSHYQRKCIPRLQAFCLTHGYR
jgi:DNA-directed RNA polymerase specialized sigma24 family protein